MTDGFHDFAEFPRRWERPSTSLGRWSLGRDCSGLVNPAVERTHNFESDLDHSRLSDEFRRAAGDEVLRSVKAKRRTKAA
jgi:hypothetical protein